MGNLLPGKGKKGRWRVGGVTYYYMAGKLVQRKSNNPRGRTGKRMERRWWRLPSRRKPGPCLK